MHHARRKIGTERCSDADDRHRRQLGFCRDGAAEAAPREVGGCWLGPSGSAPALGAVLDFMRWRSSWGVISEQPLRPGIVPQGLTKALVPLPSRG